MVLWSAFYHRLPVFADRSKVKFLMWDPQQKGAVIGSPHLVLSRLSYYPFDVFPLVRFVQF
jgi:hypothetical protein